MVLRRRHDRRSALARAIIAAKTGSAKLERMAARLEARREELESRVEEAIMKGDREAAKRYAVEAAQLRSLLRRVIYLQTVLERLRLRLETAFETGVVAASLRGVMEVVGELKAQDLAAIPELGITLGEIEESLRSIGLDYTVPEAPSTAAPPSSSEAQRILEEARLVAEERLKDSLPKP